MLDWIFGNILPVYQGGLQAEKEALSSYENLQVISFLQLLFPHIVSRVTVIFYLFTIIGKIKFKRGKA